MRKTPSATTTTGNSGRAPRAGQAARNPAAARAMTSGAASVAVVGAIEAISPIRRTTVKPSGGSRGGGNSTLARRAARSPQPVQRASSRRGKTIQERSIARAVEKLLSDRHDGPGPDQPQGFTANWIEDLDLGVDAGKRQVGAGSVGSLRVGRASARDREEDGAGLLPELADILQCFGLPITPNGEEGTLAFDFLALGQIAY